MKTAEDVDEMLRLRACGWGAKRIGRHLGCSHHTVKRYLEAGGAVAFRPPARVRALDGHEDWLRERFLRHRGNADVVRQELIAEKDVLVSLRTVERAVTSWRQALKAEALATVRFETPPGRQRQIDFGERFAEIAGERVKVFLFVATLGYSRRVHVRAFRGERQENWLTGLESAFTTFGGVPEEVLIDNPRALVTTHDATTLQVTFNPTFLAFARHWGFVPRAFAPSAGLPMARTSCCSGRRASARPILRLRSAGRRSWPDTPCSSRPRRRWWRALPGRMSTSGWTTGCWPCRNRNC